MEKPKIKTNQVSVDSSEKASSSSEACDDVSDAERARTTRGIEDITTIIEDSSFPLSRTKMLNRHCTAFKSIWSEKFLRVNEVC